MHPIHISSDVGSLTGTLLMPKEKSTGKALLFVHGWLSNEEGYIRRAKALVGIGYTCLTFNLPGHGTSEGDLKTLTRKEYLTATVAAFDYLARQAGVDLNAIGVVGASFGGYLEALLTEKRPIRWLAMRAPANYEDEGFESLPQVDYKDEHPDTEHWREKALHWDKTAALRAVHAYPHEILVIESEKDTIVPHQSVQNYIDAAPDPSKLTHAVLRGADHPLSQESYKQEFIIILVDWFRGKVRF